MNVFNPSTPESRAAHEAQRAAEYPATDERLAPLRASLARRLLQAGVNLPAEAFHALVLDMARFALRWSREEVRARSNSQAEDARPELESAHRDDANA
jgi:hypothetical protein